MKLSPTNLRGYLRLALRALRRNPGFAATAILSLALGVFLTALTLAVMNSYLVRAMPFPHADRLYRVLHSNNREPEPQKLELVDWASLRDVVEVPDSSKLERFILNTEDYPQEIFALQCAPLAVDALGVRATVGRSFQEPDFYAGGEKVAMISHALWRERFGGDASVVGKTLRATLANSGAEPTKYRIIGILPPGFRYVGNFFRGPADIAIPLTEPRPVYLARLRPNVPLGFAERRITDAVRAVTTAIPANWSGVRLESVQANYVRDLRPVLIGVTIAAGLVLLIVVTNVAVLMLLRALRRQKETAIRVALGAEFGHLARQLLSETLVICGSASVLGIALASLVLRGLGPQIEARLGRPVPGGVAALAVDWSVLLWIGGIGVVMVTAISILPLIGARPGRLGEALKSDGPRGTDKPVMRRVRASLVALQIATSTALLIGGGLMIRTVIQLSRTDLGFRTQQIFRPRIQLPERTYPTGADFSRYYDRLSEQLATLPNVSFALTTFVPFWEPPKQVIALEGRESTEVRASLIAGGPDFFQTLGIGLLGGRAFRPKDRAGSEPVAVVSESLARALSPGSIVGQRIRVTQGTRTAPTYAWRTVIGVVRDVHQTRHDVDLMDVYTPFAQENTRFASVYLRAEGSADKWLQTVRALSAEIDPEVFIGPGTPLAVQAGEEMAGPKFVMALLTAFAVMATLIALFGVYGTTAYGVRQREREIAIRIAIGATPGAVVRMFLRAAGLLFVGSMAVGLGGGAAISQILRSQLYGVERFDPWALGVSGVLLFGAGLLATRLAVRRAANADPMVTLRAE